MRQPVDALGGLVLAHGDDDPPVLYGPPGRLRGTLRLTNPTGEKLKVGRLVLDGGDLAEVARARAVALQLAARLAPGEHDLAAATVALDPRTPPGTYEVGLSLGDRRQRVVLHVVDHVDLRISPDVVHVFTNGERSFARRFVVENAGNVPLRLGDRCAAVLVDQLERRAAARGAGRRCADDAPAGDRPAGERDALRDLLCEFERQQVGPVLLDRPDETLQPGEVRAGAARILLPAGLRPHRRYEARLRLYNASVVLEVTTGRLGDAKPDDVPG